MEVTLVKQVASLMADLRKSGLGTRGGGIGVVDMSTLMQSLEDSVLKVGKEEEVVGVGDVLLHPIDGIFGFIADTLKRRSATAASLRSDVTDQTIADGGIKSAVDIVSTYLNDAGTHLKATDMTYVLRTCSDLLRSTSATKGISAFQVALFTPITAGLQRAKELSIPSGSLGIADLVETLIRSCTGTKGKTAASSSKKMRKHGLETLGLLCKLYPAECANRGKEMLAVFKETLSGLVGSEDPDMTVAAGLLCGLNDFMHHFSDAEDLKWTASVYNFMVRGMELTDHTRHEVPRAALRLLRYHAKFFKLNLFADEGMLLRIKKLVNHRNTDVRKAALPACEPFAATLAQGMSECPDTKKAANLFKSMFSKVKALAYTTDSTHTTSLGILLLGHMAASAVKFSGPETGITILNMILSRFYDVYEDLPSFEGQAEDNIRLLPSFINAVAAAVSWAPSLPPLTEARIANCIRITWHHYARKYVFASTRAKADTAIVHLFLACYQKGDSLMKILQAVVFQLVAMSIGGECEVEQDAYMSLWTAVLSTARIPYGLWDYPWDAMLNLSTGQHCHMNSIVFDVVATTVMGMLDKLDLGVKASPVQSSVLDTEPLPNTPNDFLLFLNLVTFWNVVFSRVSDSTIINDWSLPLALKYTELSGTYPHVSGFYKLLTGLVDRCESTGYLKGVPLTREPTGGEVVVGDCNDDDEEGPPTQEADKPMVPNRSKELHTILLKFIDVTMCSIPDMKGELLVAGITFLLTMPVRLLNLRAMTTPLTTALTTGLSYPPIAAIAVSALEKWLDTSPVEVQHYLAPNAVGVLQSFLTAVHGKTVDTTDQLKTNKKHGNNNAMSANEIEQLQEIQQKVVIVLGKLGSGIVASLVTEDGEGSKKKSGNEVVSWGVGETKVVIRLPFGETKQDLAFDKLLPRICELAATSNDRKTKTAACELLHSLILWMIGTNARSARSMEDNPAPTPYHAVYRKVFPVVIKLAVDPEPIAATLFSKLLLQLVHWLTQNTHFESKETMALLDSLMDGLTSQDNSALRGVCATACAEFSKYSIKQGAETAVRNLMSVTSRLHNLFVHPDPWKRHGAGVAFSKVVTEMYNNDDAIATHLMHGVYSAVLSLSMCEDGLRSDGRMISVPPTVAFLGKAERIVVRKTQLLIYKTDKRRVNLPLPTRGLESLVSWLLEQCFFEDRLARRWSMRLFLTFSSCLPGYDAEDGPRRWLGKSLKEKGGSEQIISMMESKIMKLPLTESEVHHIPYEKYCLWAKDIETCADAYNWLFAHHLLDPSSVLKPSIHPAKRKKVGSGGGASPVKIKTPTLLPLHVKMFLAHWVKGLEDEEEVQFARITPTQRSALSAKRTQVYEAVVPLVTLLCNTHPELAKPFLSFKYYFMLCVMMCQPSVLGYDPQVHRTQAEVPAMAKRGLQAILKVFGNDDEVLLEAVAHVFKHTKCDVFKDGAVQDLLGDMQDSRSNMKSVAETTFLIRGARGLHQLGLLHLAVPLLHEGLKTKEDISSSLAGNLALLPIDLLTRPGSKQVVREFWKLCFDLEITPSTIISLLTDPTPLTHSDLAEGRVVKSFSNLRAITGLEEEGSEMTDPNAPTKGDIFYTTHRAEICEYLFLNPHLLEAISSNGYHRVLLDTAALCKASRNSKLCENFVEEAGRGGLLTSLLTTSKGTDEDISNVLGVATVLLGFGIEHKKPFPCKDGIANLLESQLTQSGVLRLPPHKLVNICKTISATVPYLLRHNTDGVQRILENFIADQLPVHHDEVFGSTATESLTRPYTMIVDALLEAMEASGSVPVLRVMLPLFRGTGSHPFGDKIGAALGRFFENLDEEATVECANTCVRQFLNPELPADVRYAATNRICVLALQRLPEAACENFFSAHVAELFQVTTADWPMKDAEECFSSLLSRTSAFALLELMYRMCSPESTKNAINQAFATALLGKKAGQSQFSGKEMNDKTIRQAHAACTQSLACRELMVDVRATGISGKAAALKYHQTAYGCLTSALIATQTNHDLITRALFVPRKGDCLWENILDLEEAYVFEVKTSFALTRRAIQGLRNEWETTKGDNTGSSLRSKRGNAYLLSSSSSQYLQGSSLAAAAENPDAPVISASQVVIEGKKEEGEEEASEAAAEMMTQQSTQAVVAPMSIKKHKEALSQDEPPSTHKQPPPITPMKSQVGRTWFGTQNSESVSSQMPLAVQTEGDGDLEMDVLNKIPVMSTVLRVVLFLKGYQNPDSREPPMWMSELLSKVSSPLTHQNIKLFITKVVLNLPDVFRGFASMWVVPVIDAGVESKAASPGISYFLRDVVMTLLGWNEEVRVTSFEVEAKASLMLEVLLKSCSHLERRVLQSNLELIKIFVEQWKERIRVGPEHKRIILGWLGTSSSADPTSNQWVKARVTGLQLLGVLLANNIKAFDTIQDVSLMSEEEFYSRLCTNLPPHPQNKILPKDLIESSAEVVGMILNQHSELNQTCAILQDKVSRKLRALHGGGHNEQFLLFLGGVVRHYPPAADEFLPHRLIRILSHTRGPYKAHTLDITTKRAEHFPSIYSEFHPFVSELLTTGSTDVKLLTFSLLGKAVAVSSPKDLSHFVVNLSMDIKTRLIPMGCLTLDAKVALYDCWIKVFDSKWEELDAEGRHCLTTHLLGGLQDNSTYIRDKLLRFWDDGTRLPTSVFKRLERLFVSSQSNLTLYSPELGDKWLQYSSILLLFLSHRSPDFTDRTSFFRDPLVNCAYTELPVDTSSEYRSAVTMTPMFAMSQSQEDATDPREARPPAGYVMATATNVGQSMAPPTQSQTATNFAHYEPRKAASVSLSQTTMLFQPFQADPMMPPPPLPTTMGPAATQYHPYGHVMRRRFKKQKADQKITGHAIHATQTVRFKDIEEDKKRRTAASNVKMWRTYRDGEVPDVQISPSGILLPLEALCLYDIETARLVLGELFTRLYKSLVLPDDSQDASTGGMQSILGPLAAVTTSGAVDKSKLRQMLTNSLIDMLSGMQRFPGVISFVHTLLMDNDDYVAASLSAPVVYQSSIASRNVRSGVLLIEKGIAGRALKVKELEKDVWKRGGGTNSIYTEDSQEKGKKTAVGGGHQDDTMKKLQKENNGAWMYIARMYEYLGEEDAARSVVEDRLLTGEAAAGVGLVIAAEYEKALAVLNEAIDKMGTQPAEAGQVGLSQNEQEYFLKAEKRKCLRQLLKWEALSGECDECMLLDDDKLFTDPKNLELLKCHIDSKSRLAQEDKNLALYLMEFSQDALSTNSKTAAEVVGNNFCLPLALLSLKGNNHNAARGYVDMALNATLKEWIGLPPSQRSQSDVRTLLASLQPIVEVDEYLKLVLAGDQGKDIGKHSRMLLQRWWNRCEAFDGDSLQWDAFTNSRGVLCGLLETYVQQNAREAGADALVTSDDISGHMCSVLLKAAGSMQDRGLNNPARAFLHQYATTREKSNNISGSMLDVDFTVTAVRNSLGRAKAATGARGGKMFSKTLQYIEAENKKHDIITSHPSEYYLLKAEAYRGLAEFAEQRESPEDTLEASKHALLHYRNAATRTGNKTHALEQLGLFTDTLLSKTGLQQAGTDTETLATLLVKSYLGAIQSGDSNIARVRLPRVLEMAEKVPAVKETIRNYVQKIDSWVLLPWVNQFVSYLGGRAGDVAAAILTKVSRKFPQQVFYALSASSDDLDRLSGGGDEGIAKRLSLLQQHVEGNLTDGGEVLKQFVTALERVHNPDLRLKYWLEEVTATAREYVMKTMEGPAAQERLKKLWVGMVKDLFDTNHGDQSSLNKKFAEKTTKVAHGMKVGKGSLYQDIEAVLKPAIRKVATLDVAMLEVLAKKSREWQNTVKASWSHAKAAGPMPLATFSTWLSEFKSTPHEQDTLILLPQQPFLYLDSSTPRQLPDISSFGPNVLVMNSIQKPKRIIVHGSDHGEYPFLLKGGEDLRQDQRIQQMFYLFNSCMRKDMKCKQRSLCVRGYSVIPISPRVGLVEWVGNTRPMKGMIESQLPGGGGVQMQPAARKHHEFIVSLGKGSDWVAGFRALYGEHGKTDLEGKFEELSSELDSGYFKRSLAALCVSHAAFYTARNKFTSSFCAASIAQWLLGIGDRHLDNFLVDTNSVTLVPIDFGHAFGSATEMLHVPELMPIRLTPQLQAVWEPVGVSLLKGGMAACLDAMRDNSRMLMDVLSVFVREPLATWQRTASKKSQKQQQQQQKDGGDDAAEQRPHEAYSAAKIETVRKKLSLVNPWVTTADDLSTNTIAASTTLRHKNGVSNARAILKGRPGRNIRADTPKICRSTTEQVSCLIDMATDPNILCRTYMGWAPLF